MAVFCVFILCVLFANAVSLSWVRLVQRSVSGCSAFFAMRALFTNLTHGLTFEPRNILYPKGFTSSITGSMKCRGIHMGDILAEPYIQVLFPNLYIPRCLVY